MGSGGVVVVVVVLAHLHLLSSVLDFWTRYERHQCNKCLTFRFFFFLFETCMSDDEGQWSGRFDVSWEFIKTTAKDALS